MTAIPLSFNTDLLSDYIVGLAMTEQYYLSVYNPLYGFVRIR